MDHIDWLLWRLRCRVGEYPQTIVINDTIVIILQRRLPTTRTTLSSVVRCGCAEDLSSSFLVPVSDTYSGRRILTGFQVMLPLVMTPKWVNIIMWTVTNVIQYHMQKYNYVRNISLFGGNKLYPWILVDVLTKLGIWNKEKGLRFLRTR